MAGRIAYYGNIVKDGLVLCLDAAKRDSYPGSGTVWRDISGFGNNGTLTNGPTFSSGNYGSIRFDGVDDYVELGNLQPSILNTLTITYNVWLKWNGSGLFGCVIGNEPAGLDINTMRGFGIRRRSSNRYWLSPGAGSPLILETSPLNINIYSNYHMVTGVLTGTQAIIYVNGTSLAQASWTNAITSTYTFKIGTTPLNSADHINSDIASAQIYNRALSAQEILQNYNATKTRYNIS